MSIISFGNLFRRITKKLDDKKKQAEIEAAKRIIEIWQQEDHRQNGHTTYTHSLVIEEGSDGVYVKATAPYAKYLEHGTHSFDMKPGLLKNAKIGKHGRYRVVPLPINRIRGGNVGDKIRGAGMFSSRAHGMASGVMFRTVTDRQVGKWIHPGIKAMNLREKTAARVKSELKHTNVE
jgi:hypothetical protein